MEGEIVTIEGNLRRQGEKGSLGRRRANFTLVTGEKKGKGGQEQCRTDGKLLCDGFSSLHEAQDRTTCQD